MIPSEYSSGETRRQGGITKTGNGRARRALIEAAWAYRYNPKISTHIQKRLESLPKPIQDIGWKAQLRLCKRFRRLSARGKHANITVTATGTTIEDMGSKNGTFVGVERVTSRRTLSDGDEITVGPARMMFRQQPANDSTVSDSAIRR